MTLVSRALLLLLPCFLLSCSESEVVLPEVNVAFVGYPEGGDAQFLLRSDPAPTADLSVLLEFVSETEEDFHIWAVLPKGTSSKQLSVPMVTSIAWEVSILRFWETDPTDYPSTDVNTFGGSPTIIDGNLSGYILGSASRVQTVPFVEPVVEEPVIPPPDGMVLIPAGEFEMGSNDGWDSAKPIHTVYVDAFYMDEYEVTVGAYKAFIQATGHMEPHWDAVAEYSPTDQHPMIYVSWSEAMAYSIWAGKRLPTEAEWEKAARGGLIGKRYPWGNAAPDGTQCNFADRHTDYDWSDKNADDGYQYTAPVGSYIANGYGLYDMAGNVVEWCLDEWDEDFYAKSPRENPIAGATSINQILDNYTNIWHYKRVLRGGSLSRAAQDLRVANRFYTSPISTSDLGFRCVRTVTP